MEVDDDVRRFIDAVTPERRRRDAETLLEGIVARSYRTLTSGTYGLRARAGKEE